MRDSYTDHLDLRESLYAGDLFLCPPLPSSQRLVSEVKTLLKKELSEDYRAHAHVEHPRFFELIGKLRRTIYLDPHFHALCIKLIDELGFDLAQTSFDPARLRVICHDGIKNSQAAPVYYAHRDTWYAHPQALITLWIPLDDLSREETFHFYPDYFSKSVPNNSEIFNYAHWVKDGWDLKIGWQNKEENQKHNAQFPKLTGGFDRDHIIDFECKASQILLFSGAQFHQTFNQLTYKTRFSLDLRIVYLPDVERQHGAPNCDNRSQGSSVKDYFACVL